MTPDPDLARRRLLAGALATPAALALAGCQGPGPGDRQLRFADLAVAEAEGARLAAATALHSATAWSLPQTLVHAAQSIEYSMQGFPQAKPAWFQHTLGAAAFAVFSWRGRMSHDLAEPIPGAPALAADLAPAAALRRLRASVEAFRAWTGPLRPHFAYGALDKVSYEQAHAMHLANHLSAFDVTVA